MVTAEAICSAHLRGTSAARIPLIRWSLDAVVDSLRASELLECRCRPDLNADRAPTEAAVVTKCQDPACTGLFRVVVHPRHGLGGPARSNALGASLVALRPRRGPWAMGGGARRNKNGLNPIAHATGLNKNLRFLLF